MTDAAPAADQPLAGRVALVLGASRGIGRAAAAALAAAGAHVIAAARTQGGLEELDDDVRANGGEAVTLVPLDLTNGDELDILGAEIHRRWGRLDILVFAAGQLGASTPVPHLEPKVWDRIAAVNMTAAYRAIRSLDPLLRASDAGRGVFLSSGVTSTPRAFFGPYAATKAGMEALVRTYALEVAHTPLRLSIMNPGPIRTRMRAEAFPGEDPMTLPAPEEVAPLIVELSLPDREPPAKVVQFYEWSGRTRAN